MASGKTHDITTYVLLLPVFGLAYGVLKTPIYLSLLLTAGVWLGGFFLSPDLDTPSRPFYRWGVFRCIWWPYQWMAAHRSWLSHGVIIGPVLRIMYVLAWLVLGYVACRLLLPQVFYGLLDLPSDVSPTLGSVRREVWRFFEDNALGLSTVSAGIFIGCLLHVGLDCLSSLLKTGRFQFFQRRGKP